MCDRYGNSGNKKCATVLYDTSWCTTRFRARRDRERVPDRGELIVFNGLKQAGGQREMKSSVVSPVTGNLMARSVEYIQNRSLRRCEIGRDKGEKKELRKEERGESDRETEAGDGASHVISFRS